MRIEVAETIDEGLSEHIRVLNSLHVHVGEIEQLEAQLHAAQDLRQVRAFGLERSIESERQSLLDLAVYKASKLIAPIEYWLTGDHSWSSSVSSMDDRDIEYDEYELIEALRTVASDEQHLKWFLGGELALLTASGFPVSEAARLVEATEHHLVLLAEMIPDFTDHLGATLRSNLSEIDHDDERFIVLEYLKEMLYSARPEMDELASRSFRQKVLGRTADYAGAAFGGALNYGVGLAIAPATAGAPVLLSPAVGSVMSTALMKEIMKPMARGIVLLYRRFQTLPYEDGKLH